MKSIFLKSLALGLITLSLWSCKKDETKVVSNISPTGTLVASATTLTLVQSNGSKPALTLTYPLSASTGYVVPVSSTLQFDLKGNNFTTAKEIVVSATTYAPTVSDLNNMLLALGGKIGVPAQVEVRLKSGAAVNAMTYSNVITLNATPYLASAWIYVPGAYQGWDPKTADSLVSLTSNGIYTGIINYTAGNLEFKVTPGKNFDNAFGDAGSGAISTSGGNLNAGSAGLKQLTIDVNKKIWSVAAVKVWAIIGDATSGGWDADTDLKFVNDGKGGWKITTTLKVGELKFRQDHKWDLNYGLKDGNFVVNGDNNIKIASAGSYTITLTFVYDPSDASKITGASYSIVKN